jgi:hypothetical protein
MLCVLFDGVFEHIAFARSRTALIATLPIVAAMAAIAAGVAKGPIERPSSRSPRQRFTLVPPSVDAVHAAFLRGAEEPLKLGWIVAGICVNVGVITTALVLAVVLGTRLGVDFAAVDRGEGAVGSAGPLILLAVSALSAFPFAGYLVSRASGARSVLEPTIAAVLAIVAVAVMLGLAAPVAVVFVIASAPIALGLAGVGAWFGVRDQ